MTTIGNKAFFENEVMRSVVIPDTVTRIEVGAFNSCPYLSEVKLLVAFKYINSAFNNCKSLTYIVIPKGVGDFYNK